MNKRLYRSRHERMIAGVCGGLGEYFGADPTLMRLLFVVVIAGTGGVWLLAYLILAVVVPLAPDGEPAASAVEGAKADAPPHSPEIAAAVDKVSAVEEQARSEMDEAAER